MKNLIEQDLKIAMEVKKRLIGTVDILDFRIFSSRVRGEAQWDSDMDLYIEVTNITKEQRKFINETTWEVGFENDLIISPVVVTKDQLENTPFRVTPIYQVIQQEGFTL